MPDEIEAFKEGAKAVQEVAKATTTAIDAGRSADGWLDRIFGPGIEQAVALRWSDRVRARRIEAAILDWERLELLSHKVRQRLQAQEITQTRIPPPKTMLPLLEHATMEYEDNLHTLWANLLASAVNPSTEQIERKYVSVLAELSGADAQILKSMFAEWMPRGEMLEAAKGEGRYSSGISGFPGNDETTVILLYRLGILRPVDVEINEYHPGGHSRVGDYPPSIEKVAVPSDLAEVAFTEFGERFCKAVMGDVKGERNGGLPLE